MVKTQNFSKITYVACTVVKQKDSGQTVYLPIVTLEDDLETYTIAASSDLIGVQFKNQPIMTQMSASGIPVVILPIPAEKFKKISETIASNINRSVNGYLDAVKEYERVFGFLGNNPAKKDVSYYLYSAIMGQNPPCVLSSSFEPCEPGGLDILMGLSDAAKLSEDFSDNAILNSIELLQGFEDDDDYEDYDDDIDDLY